VELWKVAVGLVIVTFVVREMLQDLFHPTRSGALGEWVGSGFFRLFRRWKSLLPTAGPATVVTVILLWAVLLAVGFAFIYWSVFPQNFTLKTANLPDKWNEFWWCIYYSLEMLTTLGLGDIQPNPNWLRIVSATHTLIGFSLVTASITWIVLLFPALSRMRTLARKSATLDDAERATGVSPLSPGMHLLIAGLAEEVIRTRVDLVHFPILFYFYAEDPRASLAHAVQPLTTLARRGCNLNSDPLVRFASHALQVALNDLADHLGERLELEDRSPDSAFGRFVEMHTPVSGNQTN
jgi:hypothetical protein